MEPTPTDTPTTENPVPEAPVEQAPDFSRPGGQTFPSTQAPQQFPPTQAPQQLPLKKKHKYLKTLLIVLLCEVLVGFGVTAFFWRDGEALKQEIEYEEQILEMENEFVDMGGDEMEDMEGVDEMDNPFFDEYYDE